MTFTLQKLAAFPYLNAGGNPAGVVLNGEDLDATVMQRVAAEVGYSETAFVTKRDGSRLRVRYFSPEMEVDFCGHATIATGVALGYKYGAGSYVFETNTGDVIVDVKPGEIGYYAELTSQLAEVATLEDQTLDELLVALRWTRDRLSSQHRPLVVNAGNAHPVLVLDSLETLQELSYDFEALKELCRTHKWPTIQLVAQESRHVWQSRNPFAFGGVYEDPATGSAAAAFGVYLRETGLLEAGAKFEIKQGFAMGQPCLLRVEIGSDYCRVSGTAVAITA